MAASPLTQTTNTGQDACTCKAWRCAFEAVNDYELGSNLRRQILDDLERGLPSDGRRLQALVGDLCGNSQLALLPALKYLVMTPAFSSVVAQQPPLAADQRQQLRLQQELNQVFAAPICERMDAVLRGLLALSATNGIQPPPAAAIPQPPAAPLPVQDDDAFSEPVQEGGSSGGVVAVLSFIAGVLVVGVGGGLAWLLLQTNQPTTEPSSTGIPGLNGTPATPEPQTPSTATPPAPDLGLGSTDAATAQAVNSVEQLYNELSMGNMQAARQRFSSEAADQFDPAFFRQFQRVSVDQLQETGRNGSVVTLQGLVTFVYPDGTSQSESRSFTVDTATTPSLITSSSFGQVVKGRQ
jgi:hypothetical protein